MGPWKTIRKYANADLLAGPPEGSGVFARFVGVTKPLLELENQRGEPAGSIGKGGGLVAALRTGDGPPTWVVTGTDAKGVAAARRPGRPGSQQSLCRRDAAGCGGDWAAGPVRPALAYAPGRSPLHRALPGAAIAYLGGLATAGFIYSSPLVLVAAGLVTAFAGYAAGAGRAVRASLRFALPLLILMMAINVLVSHRGDTVLVRGFEMPVLGNTDVTFESLADGATIGLRVVAVVIAFAVYSACVDPDRVLRALRPVARRSAMTAGLVTRMVPLAAADGARLREAAELRGPAAEPVTRAALARRLVEGSLDRAVDVAATLELRGHSLEVRTRLRRERSRDDAPVLAAGVAILVAAVAARIAGAGGFETYPRIAMSMDGLTLALCLALPVLAAVPFVVWRWRSRG